MGGCRHLAHLARRGRREGLEIGPSVQGLHRSGLHRALRTAVCSVADAQSVPQALLHNMKHNQALHQRHAPLTVKFAEVPWVADEQRIRVADLGRGSWRVTPLFGFMDTPDVPQALTLQR